MTTPKPFRVCAFFQHMPPAPRAGSRRGESIFSALSKVHNYPEITIEVFTPTINPTPLPGVNLFPIGRGEVKNTQGVMSRVLAEIHLGLVAAKSMFRGGATCDFAIISSPSYLAALIVAAAARRFGVPYVIELRDIYPQSYSQAGLISKNSIIYRFFSRRTERFYAGSCAVICATQGLAIAVQEQVPQTVVYSVYNGFPANLMRRQSERHERFTVCFHGTLGYFQDAPLLLEVARQLIEHNIEVLVIGHGRDEGLVSRANLPNLRFLGRLSFEETIAQVERCHVGLCLRKEEDISRDAFPVKVWEYLGLGIPSIVTPICEAGHFLESHSCGYQLPGGEAPPIVKAISRLKGDRKTLKEMSSRCREVARSYTREKTGMQVAEIIFKKIQDVSLRDTRDD